MIELAKTVLKIAIVVVSLLSSIDGVFLEKNSVDPNDIEFLLYTKSNAEKADRLIPGNKSTLESSHFISGSPLKLIFHGFKINNASIDWMPSMKDAYVNSTTKYNVILVKWDKLCRNLAEFPTVTMNTYVAGKYGAKLLDMLVERKVLDMSNVHIIGHSIGSHAAAFAANLVRNGVVPRVTGLDAAEFVFGDFGKDGKLDASDAKIVDLIHTDGGFIAYDEPGGTSDFFPNGGKHPQPGCNLFDQHCSHVRAVHLFVESINNPEAFRSLKCANYSEYKKKNCRFQEVSVMGNSVDPKASGSYFLETNSKAPYSKN